MSKTKEQILSDYKRRMVVKDSTIDLSSGTVTADLGVESFAEEQAAQYALLDEIRGIAALDSTYISDLEADKRAAAIGLTRLAPSSATGEITFGALSNPLQGADIVIPAGTIVKASNSGTSILYKTTAIAYLTSASPLNPQSGYYETTVGIVAITPGTIGNVGIGYINSVQSSLDSGISAVYNKNALTNGTDIESTERLLERIKLKENGRNATLVTGLEGLVWTNPKVSDVLIVDPDHEFSIRGPGAVDAYVQGVVSTQHTQTVTVMTRTAILEKTPVLLSSGVSVIVGGSTYTLDDNVFTIEKDTESVFLYSNKALDKLVWTEAGYPIISGQDSYQIIYFYNSLMTELQTLVDASENRPLTGDTLIRDTMQVDVSIQMGISVLSGYDKTAVIQTVKSNIQNFVNVLKLGKPLRQSDIINIVENSIGVDYIVLPLGVFNKTSEVAVHETVTEITVYPLEYLRITDVNLLVE